MRVIMFKDRFADLVRDGIKRQTIRPKRKQKNTPRPGEVMSFRRWTGKPYRSKQEQVATGLIEAVEEVEIRDEMPLPICVKPPSPALNFWPSPDKFARADGFADWPDMRDWFKATHGLPFHGILIRWKGAN